MFLELLTPGVRNYLEKLQRWQEERQASFESGEALKGKEEEERKENTTPWSDSWHPQFGGRMPGGNPKNR